ncbi:MULTISPECIES: hypothetical protein [unclassified Nocardiopsis]|uniref:hypothetical protein n=1 Tax=Nocardiopsis TaxID=2013 RepID=UPI00387AAE50
MSTDFAQRTEHGWWPAWRHQRILAAVAAVALLLAVTGVFLDLPVLRRAVDLVLPIERHTFGGDPSLPLLAAAVWGALVLGERGRRDLMLSQGRRDWPLPDIGVMVLCLAGFGLLAGGLRTLFVVGVEGWSTVGPVPVSDPEALFWWGSALYGAALPVLPAHLVLYGALGLAVAALLRSPVTALVLSAALSYAVQIGFTVVRPLLAESGPDGPSAAHVWTVAGVETAVVLVAAAALCALALLSARRPD